ncbi:MAG: SemiSWEET transporter [Candidatus Omnitrophota bacterium]|nr:SemiSWEET transporter [Candidatus Omnitrophota bacterium]
MVRLILGIMAGTLTTISFIPQVIKIYRTKDAGDLSIATFTIFSCGVFLWLLYGIAAGEWPIILANGVTLILIFLIIAMKIGYR